MWGSSEADCKKKRFNQDLTRDPSKRITAPLTSNHQHRPCTLADLLAQVHDNHETCVKERLPAQIHVQNILTTINEHARVIDILIQQQPDITSIVWGAFRFLIGVSLLRPDVGVKTSCLMRINPGSSSWDQYHGKDWKGLGRYHKKPWTLGKIYWNLWWVWACSRRRLPLIQSSYKFPSTGANLLSEAPCP